MIIVEGWWSSVLKGDHMWVTHILSTEVCCGYTRVARGQDVLEVKSMIDLVMVKKDMLQYVQDVRVVRAMGLVPSDHHVVLCKVR